MHELSIAASIVEAVTETASRYPGARVKEVRLQGWSSGLGRRRFAPVLLATATEDTSLAGSTLVINTLPVIVRCESCGVDSELDGVQSFRCPHCGEPSADLRQGREMEIESIELEDSEPDAPKDGAPKQVEEQT